MSRHISRQGLRQRTRLLLAMRRAGVSVRAVARSAQMNATSVSGYLDGVITTTDERRALVADAARALGVTIPDHPWESVTDPDFVPPHNQPRAQNERQEDTPVIPSRTDLMPPDVKYFDLVDDPFDVVIAANNTWTCDRTKLVDHVVLRAIRRQRIVAVVGDVGAGKTSMMRRLRHQLDNDESMPARVMTPGNLNRGSIQESALTAAMLRDLGGETAGQSAESRGHELRQRLEQRRDEGELPVLLIDEAHEMSTHGLIAVKRLWDSFTLDRLMSVILVGQLSLRHRLETNVKLKELTGRTTIAEIPRLGPADIASYLDYRLRLVGGELERVFARDSIAALVNRGAVYPLWLDALASRSMQLARQTQSKRVTAAIVTQASMNRSSR